VKTGGATRVAVVGASGYAGEELVRLLLAHPHVDLAAVTSRQYAGQALADVFPKFSHFDTARTLHFTDSSVKALPRGAEVAFLALPHGLAAEFAFPLLESGARVIDLSADFRTKSAETYREFYGVAHPAPQLLEQAVYGLPELRRAEIQSARLVACPGCYPTSILLPTIPLLRAGLIQPDRIIADSMSGVSGAGRKVELDYLFAECNESLRPYGVPKHRHLSEIEQELSTVAGSQITIQFTPHLVPVSRGILTTIYLEAADSSKSPNEFSLWPEKIADAYRTAFASEPFVRLLEGGRLPDTKNVAGTNFIEIAWRIDPRTGRLIVMSAIDNVVKGTSGQAVQCFNLMCGLPETAGLF
jgi:N-acetyl-gamma-glutamyl-phosphate reductase